MQKPVLVETSARHVHVSRRVLDILFGEGYELTHKKDLSQPGQFACEERVQVIGPKNSFPAVSILGPVRPETQVELSWRTASSSPSATSTQRRKTRKNTVLLTSRSSRSRSTHPSVR